MVTAMGPIPFFPIRAQGADEDMELKPFSEHAPVSVFAASMHLDQAKESGYCTVEDTAAGYLSPSSPAMRLGRKPLLPSPVARHQAALMEKSYLGRKPLLPCPVARPLLPSPVVRHQAALMEKSYLAAGQAACSINTEALLQRYWAKPLTESPSALEGDDKSAVELRGARDLSLCLTRHSTPLPHTSTSHCGPRHGRCRGYSSLSVALTRTAI